MTRGGKEVVGRRVVVTSEFEANRKIFGARFKILKR